jgi:hypothetical protein
MAAAGDYAYGVGDGREYQRLKWETEAIAHRYELVVIIAITTIFVLM